MGELMKSYAAKYIRRSFLIGCSVLALSGGVALAQTTTSQADSMLQRVSERKTALKLQLSTDQSQKIIKNCTAAQALLDNILTKDKNSMDKRQEVYSDLSTQLTTTIRKLGSQGLDITELKSNQMQFDNAINQYLKDAATYKTALEDAAAINCASDPVGFWASLATARQLRTVLIEDTSQIKKAKSSMVQVLAKTTKILDAVNSANKTEANQ